MKGKGVSRERFQPRACSGKNASKTGNSKNIVFIDIDGDEVDDVVVVDSPEFVRDKFHGPRMPSKNRVYTPQSVISIDDDDDDEDVSDDRIVVEGTGNLDSDACSRKKVSPEARCMQNSVHIDVDDGLVGEKDSASNLPKSGRACTAEDPARNRYGLDGSESESSDSDCSESSDCELMEREQWEKFSFKRKRNVFNDQSGHNEGTSSSGLHSNTSTDFDMENRTKQHAGGAVYSGPNNGKCAAENQSSFSVKGDSQVESMFFSLFGAENPLGVSNQKVGEASFKSPRSESIEEMQSLHQTSDIEHRERAIIESISPCNYDLCELGGKESKFNNRSQDECEREVDNYGSALSSKDQNLSEVNHNCASFEEKHFNCYRPVSNAQDHGVAASASNERDIINEREKLKETDEYKQAIKAEWASRQEQLRLQAEEAQRLRKRKRAESQRLLDMQRRQRERIEEVRETQKKDEEFMNMKEQLRVEVQKGLNELEKRCNDMTSLLRGLGIDVGGSFAPLPNEVQAACKRALFKFHPDRASKTDIREQVEAEEKFKLISRMKEKLVLTSCH